MTRLRVLYLAAWVAAAAAAAFAGAGLAADSNSSSSTCTSNDFSKRPPLTDKELTFEFKRDRLVIPFDDSRAVGGREIVVTVPQAKARQDSLNNLEGVHVRLGGNGQLEASPAHWIDADGDGLDKALIYQTPGMLKLCLAIDPARVGRLGPGRYLGTIGVYYGLATEERASLPVEVTFRASRWTAALIAVLGVLLGLTVKVLSEAAGIHRTTGVGAKSALVAYFSQLMFPVTLIVAVIAGVFSFVVLYRADAAWGASDSDWLRLFATCFVLQMSGSEALNMLGRIAGTGAVAQPAIAEPGT